VSLRDDIIRLAREASGEHDYDFPNIFALERFAALVAAAERERMKSEGWRQCAKGQRTTQFCGLLEDTVAAEREACRQLCINLVKRLDGVREASFGAEMCASGIAARSKELNSGREMTLLAGTP
jgi:hypothetical protein